MTPNAANSAKTSTPPMPTNQDRSSRPPLNGGAERMGAYLTHPSCSAMVIVPMMRLKTMMPGTATRRPNSTSMNVAPPMTMTAGKRLVWTPKKYEQQANQTKYSQHNTYGSTRLTAGRSRKASATTTIATHAGMSTHR